MDVKVGDGDLLLEMRTSTGEAGGRVVGLDDDMNALMAVTDRLASAHLAGGFAPIRANLGSVPPNKLNDTLDKSGSPHTYDVLFAPDALPDEKDARVATLRVFASRLTPSTGRMIVTFRSDITASGR